MEHDHPWPQAGRMPAFPEVVNKSSGHLEGKVIKAIKVIMVWR
jgi:hypothetical protein